MNAMDLVTNSRALVRHPRHMPGRSPRRLPRLPRIPQAAGLGELGFDWGSIINQSFDFGKIFIQSKYAKDAARSTGIYSPGGQLQATPPPVSTTQPPPGTYNQPPGSNVATGLGVGFEQLAAQFGVSSTTLVLLIVLLLYFWMKPAPKVR